MADSKTEFFKTANSQYLFVKIDAKGIDVAQQNRSKTGKTQKNYL